MKRTNNPTDQEGKRTDELNQKIAKVKESLIPKYKIEGCKVRVRLRAERPKY